MIELISITDLRPLDTGSSPIIVWMMAYTLVREQQQVTRRAVRLNGAQECSTK